MLSKARLFVFLAFAVFPITGCLQRSHRPAPRHISTAPLQQAPLEQLVAKINADAAKIQTMNATVDIATSIGGEKKGKVTEFQEIRGYVLLRKPAMLRMIGLFPVLRNRAFDMVSDGEKFRLSLPTKNKFIIGSKNVTHPSKQPLENLRPQHILEALLVREIDPKNEIAVLETGTELIKDPKTKKEVEQANYVIDVIQRDENGTWALERKIYIDRTDLTPYKQILYDKTGNVATVAEYDNFTDHNGVWFPNIIQIDRPQEEYSIQLGMVKLVLNVPLKDEQFELPQPPGAQVVQMDGPSATPPGDTR